VLPFDLTKGRAFVPQIVNAIEFIVSNQSEFACKKPINRVTIKSLKHLYHLFDNKISKKR
jgi:hypothetical protein